MHGDRCRNYFASTRTWKKIRRRPTPGVADKNMATRDELLCRLHDGEVPHSEAETLRAQITEEEQQKLHALTELDALLANTLTAEAEARELDLWAALSPQLSSQISSKAVDAVGAS